MLAERKLKFIAGQVGIGSLCSDFQGLFRQGVSTQGRRSGASHVQELCVKSWQAWKVTTGAGISSPGTASIGSEWQARSSESCRVIVWNVGRSKWHSRLVEESSGLHQLVVASLVKAGESSHGWGGIGVKGMGKAS